MKAQDENHEALNSKLDNMKIKFGDKFEAINRQAVRIKEEVQQINLESQNLNEDIQHHKLKDL